MAHGHAPTRTSPHPDPTEAALKPAPLSPRRGDLAEAVEGFEPAEPADLERVSLQRRYDRKFLVPAEQLGAALRSLRDDYRVVLAGGERFAHYDTFYFDTPTLRFYHDHRRRRAPRFKVRIRNYADRGLSVLEFKEKTSRGDTHKRRWERPDISTSLTDLDRERLAEASPRVFAEGDLVPVARTVFYRLMLVSKRSVERATLDFHLTLERDEHSRTLEGRRPRPGLAPGHRDAPRRRQGRPLQQVLRGRRAARRRARQHLPARAARLRRSPLMPHLASLLVDAASALGPRLALDVACVLAVVRLIYLRAYPRQEYAFTFWLLNLITFAVACTLSGVHVEMGLSLGLFAVFGILRYRTEALRIRDLTYLFVMIGLAILNGVAAGAEALARVALIDLAIIAAVAALEFGPGRGGEDSVTVRYDRVELLPPAQREALLADLSRRLGVPCERVVVEHVDFMHDSAQLVVTYRPTAGKSPA